MAKNRIPLLLLLLTVLLFLFFQPRLPSFFFPSVRAAKLDTFIADTIARGLDTRAFWQLREFYYPGGNFVVHREALSNADLNSFTDYTGIKLNPNESYPILVYHSAKWDSYEALVNTTDLDSLIILTDGWEIVQNGPETWIYRREGQTIILFITSMDNLRRTNGFINRDQDILKDYSHWFSLSVISP